MKNASELLRQTSALLAEVRTLLSDDQIEQDASLLSVLCDKEKALYEESIAYLLWLLKSARILGISSAVSRQGGYAWQVEITQSAFEFRVEYSAQGKTGAHVCFGDDVVEFLAHMSRKYAESNGQALKSDTRIPLAEPLFRVLCDNLTSQIKEAIRKLSSTLELFTHRLNQP